MTEQLSISQEYAGQILQPENARFIERVLQQTILSRNSFTEQDLDTIAHIGQTLDRQIHTINAPYVLHCAYSTFTTVRDETVFNEISEANQPFFNDISQIVINGIIWGVDEVEKPQEQNELVKNAMVSAISGFNAPIDSLEQFIERTEQIIGNPFHTGILEEALKNEGITLSTSQKVILDVLRVFGHSFSRQFQNLEVY